MTRNESPQDESSEAFRNALEDGYRVTQSSAFTAEVRQRMSTKSRAPFATIAMWGVGLLAATVVALTVPIAAPEDTESFAPRGTHEGGLEKRTGIELFVYEDGVRRALGSGAKIPSSARLAVRVINRSNSSLDAVLTLTDAAGETHFAVPQEEALPVDPQSRSDVREGGFEIFEFPPGPLNVQVELRTAKHTHVLSELLEVVR
ncbi:MAG: hypothetical protein AAFY60_00665 [Myxococcota bacterium]